MDWVELERRLNYKPYDIKADVALPRELLWNPIASIGYVNWDKARSSATSEILPQWPADSGEGTANALSRFLAIRDYLKATRPDDPRVDKWYDDMRVVMDAAQANFLRATERGAKAVDSVRSILGRPALKAGDLDPDDPQLLPSKYPGS